MRKSAITLYFLIIFLVLAVSMDVHAVPAFARKYRLSCSTCHNPFPRLKPYGDDFAGAGFILEEEESERDYVTAGDSLLWLNRDFPLAARVDAYGVYEQDHDVETDLQTPFGLKLMSGGTLYKSIGYYFYFYMSERGEVAGIEDAYIHFDNIFKTHLDVMVGQFQTSDPLMKRELRLTFEDYMIYTNKVGLSRTNLTYDRGVMLVYGVEKTGTDLIGMIVNGNGKVEAGDDQKFDIDSNKNIGLRINQGVGEIGSLGFFYYQGAERGSSIGKYVKNEITYMGPDITFSVGPLDFTGQYLLRTDSAPTYSLYKISDIETSGIVAELIYAPNLDRSRWYFTALYNKVDSDIDDLDAMVLNDAAIHTLGYETATLSATWEFARNLRLIGEYRYDLHNEKHRFILGCVTGF